jgi:hypothetical protein
MRVLHQGPMFAAGTGRSLSPEERVLVVRGKSEVNQFEPVKGAHSPLLAAG